MGMMYRDLSPEKQQPFEQGSALYVKGFYKTDNISFNLGYWHGRINLCPQKVKSVYVGNTRDKINYL